MPDLTEAPALGNPLDLIDPAPATACSVCVALDEQRAEARRLGDMTTVTDCNVEIRRHPHRTRS
ncbi:hypothetical protein OG244_28780 [Streptomyces brevispora]|uniref:hypothetical protein n=1 Tax=Streptomyces brevispora TaxID=887462 RepID=UPI002E33C001|nr:hypothetical protein [Streptomyces brevispora]